MTAQQINFGVGNLVLVRNDISIPTPVPFGVLQDIDWEFDFTNKQLMGQNQLAVDVARGAEKLTAKMKFARIYSGAYDLFFGQGVTPAAGVQFAINEPHTVSGTTQQVTNHSTYVADLGVFYASTGIQLTRVAPSSEATGKYSVAPSTGTYTFAVADEVALNFNYSYTVTSLNQLVLANQLAGTGPTFGCYFTSSYKGNFANFVINNATSSKLSNPFKNQDYTIQEMDIEVMQDASGNIGSLSFSQ